MSSHSQTGLACRFPRFLVGTLALSLAYCASAQPLFQDWLKRVDTGTGELGQVRAAALDASGNLHLACVINRPSTGFDWLVLRLDSNGNVVWQHQFDGGIGGGTDIPHAIVVDSFGNVLVTGSSEGAGSQADFATLRLGSDGVRSTGWPDVGHGAGLRRFNGGANGSDEALALVMDAGGNVYVTGSSVGLGASFGNVLTIKYGPTGETLWVRDYNGPGSDTDTPVAIRVDAAGNVLVLAESAGASLASDWAVIKWDAIGSLSDTWPDNGFGTGVRRFNLATTSARPKAMALAGDGGLYAVGTAQPGATGDDIVLLKLLANGQFAWTNVYNGPGNGSDVPVAVALDAAGDVVVAGTSVGSAFPGTGEDYVALKFTPAGAASTAWPTSGAGVGVRRMDGGLTSDQAAAMVLDPQGNVLIAGKSFSVSTGDDFFTAKITPFGQLLWTHRFDAGVSAAETPVTALLDAGGNLFLAGHGPGSAAANDDDDILAVRFGVQPSAASASPQYLTLTPGKSATLSPAFGGSQPMTFEWRLNGAPLDGQSGSTLVLNNLAPAAAGAYSLVVNNRAGSVTISAAELSILQLAIQSGAPALQLNGVNGRDYRLDYADEISATPAWQPLGNVTGAATAVTFNDPSPAASHARRFYRAVPLP